MSEYMLQCRALVEEGADARTFEKSRANALPEAVLTSRGLPKPAHENPTKDAGSLPETAQGRRSTVEATKESWVSLLRAVGAANSR